MVRQILRMGGRFMKVIYEDFRCKFCNSQNLVKFGKFRGVQRYFCKDCKRKFADNDALPHMRTPLEQVGSALNMYYEGMSLEDIGTHLEQMNRNHAAKSSIYGWVERFSKEAIGEAEKYKPNVGDVWVADETVLKIEGKQLWFWDIIDAKTRFLLASHISRTRTIPDAKALMEKAAKKAGKTPKYVLTDKLAAYLDGIELAFGAETKHIQTKPFTVEQNTNLIERFHGTLKDRTKVMRGIKRVDSANLFAEGWLVHYNFFRPHETLGKTPAEAAGIDFPFRSWLDVVKQPRIVIRTEDYIPPAPRPRKPPQIRIVSQEPKPTPRGVFYEGHGMVSSHPFKGGKRHKGRII